MQPDFTGPNGRPASVPFGVMEVGDEVFFAGESTYGRTYNLVKQYARRMGRKFQGRTDRDGLWVRRVG
jgi:hypothetical protein